MLCTNQLGDEKANSRITNVTAM